MAPTNQNLSRREPPMNYSSLLSRSISYLLLPVFILSQAEIPALNIPAQLSSDWIDIAQIFPNNYQSSYDDILELLDTIEEGDLENRFSTDQLNKINHFLAYLAKKGVLPNESEVALENDIQELLAESPPPYFYLCNGNGEVILCKTWVHKKWDQTKKFVKKHKKAIIIGVVCAVAVVVVVGVVSAATAASAAGAAAATGSDEKPKGSSESNQDANLPQTSEPEVQPNVPDLNDTIEERISSFKEILIEDNLLQISENASVGKDISLLEKARDLGSFLAHETLQGIGELTAFIPEFIGEVNEVAGKFPLFTSENLQIPNGLFNPTPLESYEELIVAGHKEIDNFFHTDQAERYTPEALESKKARQSNFTYGIIPPPGIISESSINIKQLLEAGKALDKADLTKAGRALMKHGYRENSAFPKPIGNSAQVNEHGQKILESILSHPEKLICERPHPDFGKVIDVMVPGKGGVRFSVDGEMIGFLEP